MSYPNFGKQHGGRGLKAFVIVVCVLLVVAIVTSALVLWRTTNHYTELPKFNDEDGEEFIITDDEDFNEDLYSDKDDESEFSDYSLIGFDVQILSCDVSSYSSPLSSASVNVTADFDLSKVNFEWYFVAEEEGFYFDGSWHDVSGEVFADDYGNNIKSYLKIADETFDSCVVEFWDYFPATTYLYYRCWNSVSEALGRVVIDCYSHSVCDSIYFYIGDLVPSFTVSDYETSLSDLSAGFLEGVNLSKFSDHPLYSYYDGFGHFYNCYECDRFNLLASSIDYLDFDTFFLRGSYETYVIDIDYLSTYCFFDGSITLSGSYNELWAERLDCLSWYFSFCVYPSEDMFFNILTYVMNEFGVCLVPCFSHTVGSVLDSNDSSFSEIIDEVRFKGWNASYSASLSYSFDSDLSCYVAKASCPLYNFIPSDEDGYWQSVWDTCGRSFSSIFEVHDFFDFGVYDDHTDSFWFEFVDLRPSYLTFLNIDFVFSDSSYWSGYYFYYVANLSDDSYPSCWVYAHY